MATLSTIWNDTIKLRDANKGTPIEKHCELCLDRMLADRGTSTRHEALEFVQSVEDGTYEPPQYILAMMPKHK